MKKLNSKLTLTKKTIFNLSNDSSKDIDMLEKAFLSLWGSNCNNSNPAQHNCCVMSRRPENCGNVDTKPYRSTPGTPPC